MAAGPRFPAPSTAFTATTADDACSKPRSRTCISTRVPGRPARGINSRGMGRPARVAMNPSVLAGPWSRGVTQETIASPGARSLDSDVKLVGAAGGSRSSGPSVTVKNGALARFCSRL